MKKTHKICIFLASIILSTTIFMVNAQSEFSNNSDIVATVNGESIYSKEFQNCLTDGSAVVYNYFYNKYEADYNEDFWNTDFEGEVPIEMLKEATLKSLVATKVQQSLMKKYNLWADTSYPSFLKELDEENKRRQKAHENGEVIYGPIEYDEMNYFSYVFSNKLIELKKKLSEEQDLSKGDITEFYEEIKDEFYKIEDTLHIEKLQITNNNLNNTFEKVKFSADNKENFKDIAFKYTDDNNKVDYREYAFVPDNAKADERQYTAKSIAQELEIGEVSDIFLSGNDLVIIKLKERINNGYYTLDDVYENVKTLYIDKEYEALIKSLINSAEVKINYDIYNKGWKDEL